MNLNQVTLADVLTSYRGRAHSCRCGCKGTYRVTAENRAVASANRGYDHSDEDVSDRSVRQTLALIQHHNSFYPVEHGAKGSDGVEWFDLQLGDRDVTVYVADQEGRGDIVRKAFEREAGRVLAKRAALQADEFLPA